MTTRREFLAAAGLTAAAGLLGACENAGQAAQAGDRLLVRHADGLGLFDSGTGNWLATPGSATANGPELASLAQGKLLTRNAETGRVSSEARLTGSWVPRAARDTQVALVESLAPRAETKLLVMRGGAERGRFELPGNLEPEAFSADGDRLFVLDHLPPTAPDGYRVRMLDLASGEIQPLLTRLKSAVPPGAEEVMRGQGRRAVYDPTRNMLFTLYTHTGEHQHTGQLLGVRPNAPDVHAFVHSLHLAEGWAYCVDLPVPFGLTGAAGHTVAMSTQHGTLYAISAEAGVAARIDPDQLVVESVQHFTPATGGSAALGLPDGRLLVGAGSRLTLLDNGSHQEWAVGFEVRGLGRGGHLWAGREEGASILDVDQRKELSTVDVPGSLGLEEVFARR